jgi:predicted aconitase
MIHLAKDEQEMLDGRQGRPKQRAMEILVQYAEALGAERFVNTNNVHLLVGFHPYPEAVKVADADELVSKILLDTEEKIRVDYVKAFNTTHIFAIDMENWRVMKAPESLHDLMESIRKYCQRTGISLTSTCTPYQVGNLPGRGEHCAWTESSAVPFCNAVLGARTNTESAHSAFAIALTGKVPLSGFHISENRLGTHLIHVDWPMTNVRDWCLLGYFAGEICQLSVPIIDLRRGGTPNLNMLKGFNSAAASSGGVMMYHILGVTPEAPTLEASLRGKKPEKVLNFGGEELRQSYRALNSATNSHVDMVNIGCPHYSLEQLREVARFLDGKKVHEDVTLWIWTAHQLKAMADRNGYTDVICKAGGQLMIDSCPLNTNLFPQGTKVVATDSAKHAHYAPAIAGVEVWFGRMEECLEAAVNGIWRGELA